ncbi:MAG: tetratricopeptide repeat protein [Blastocatellia bacterium]
MQYSDRTATLILSALLALNFLLMVLPLSAGALKIQALAWRAAIALPLRALFATGRRMTAYIPPRQRPALLFTLLVIFTTGSRAQPNAATVNPAPAAAAVSAALPDDIIRLRNEGNDAVFNLDYAAARLKFEEVRAKLPDHPAGDLYVATLIWLDHLNKSRRLQTGLYQNESFYAGADKAKEETEGDAVEQSTERAFREAINRARAKAIALVVRTNKKDADALYFRGAVYGVIAAYDASVARKFWGAMRNGSRGVDDHQEVLKLRPDYFDANLSVGLYNYIVGSLPFAMRALAAIGGIRGNRDKGIAQLEDAMYKGRYVSDDARVMLVALYQNEKRPQDALKLLQNLSQRFPKNYLLRMEMANTMAQLKQYNEAYAVYDDLLKNDEGRAADLIHFQYAEALVSGQEYARAVTHFLDIGKLPKAEAGLVTQSMLRAGQASDMAGKRAEAIAQYKAVLARPNIYDSREQAEKGLKQPHKEKEKKRLGED